MSYHSPMTQPVRLADDLVLEARLAGETLKRTVAEQIEFWAALGRTLESFLQGEQVMALQKAGKVRPLSECLRAVDTPEGRKRVASYLQGKPFPHFEAAPSQKGLWVRFEKSGRHSSGRFVGRRFQSAD
jgi:hypothetical protein